MESGSGIWVGSTEDHGYSLVRETAWNLSQCDPGAQATHRAMKGVIA
jgi:hypothetical protein